MVEVLADSPGVIIEVLVGVGDAVDEDQQVMVLESMKVEIPINAPGKGQVKEIRIAAGDAVDTDQVLMIIE